MNTPPVAEEYTAVRAEDGTEHFVMREVLRKARAPTPGSGEQEATPMTLEILKVQADRALEKMHDPKVALADKLDSQVPPPSPPPPPP